MEERDEEGEKEGRKRRMGEFTSISCILYLSIFLNIKREKKKENNGGGGEERTRRGLEKGKT